MQNYSNELCLKFSNPKISNNPIDNFIPSIDYLFINFIHLRILGLTSSFGIIVTFNLFTNQENIRSYKLDAKAFLLDIASFSFKGLSITLLPTSLVLIVKLL